MFSLPWVEILLVVFWAVSLLLILQVLEERRSPSVTAAWIFFIIALPYLGALLYLVAGARKIRRRETRIRKPAWHALEERPLEQASALDVLLRRLGCAAATVDNAISLHVEAKHAREELLRIIDGAQEQLFFLIYDFHWDKSGRQIMQALVGCAARGVKVRMLVDDLGSWLLKSDAVADFRDAGGELVRFKPVWYALPRRIANLRNHRKIVVADGRIAWTGGRNIGDEYLADGSDQARWMDLSLTIEGPAAAALEEICRSDWHFATGQRLKPPGVRELPQQSAGGVVTQIIPSGPDQRDDLWHVAFIKSCFEARERLWLITPYFVPDDAALNAITTAARCGVDVRVLVPAKSDNLIVDLVARSYLRQVQALGVKVHRLRRGMLHAKAVLADQTVLIGSANLDARSFFLNYEVMMSCEDAQLAEQLAGYVEWVAARCLGGVRSLGRLRETLASMARLVAPLL